MKLVELARDQRVVACVGAGGVGKTTLAAAIALGAARRGERALVLTVDPARRLADALGVGELGNDPRPLPPDTLQALGLPEGVRCDALMLDVKQTFDGLVERFAPDAAARARILDNPIYRHVSDALAGSAEYTAMEKLYEMHARGDYDVLVLDTPPSAHALDLLEAPARLLGLLDSAFLQHLLHPAMQAGRFGMRLFQRGLHTVFQTLERITGLGFLEDLSEFALAFESMSEGFRDRAHAVQDLLLGPDTAFVLACGPHAESVTHARALLGRLDDAGAHVAGFVANRLRMWPDGEIGPATPERRAALVAALERGGLDRAAASAACDAAFAIRDGYAAAVERDAAQTGELLAEGPRRGGFSVRVPEMREDIHDLEGLVRVERVLFGEPAQ